MWLLATAYCRTVWHVLDDVFKRAVEAYEKVAEGEMDVAVANTYGIEAYQKTKIDQGPFQRKFAEFFVGNLQFGYLQFLQFGYLQFFRYNYALWFTSAGISNEVIWSIFDDVIQNPWYRQRELPTSSLIQSLAVAAYNERIDEKHVCQQCEGYSIGKLIQCPTCKGKYRVIASSPYLDNDRLAILADALEDEGCDDTPVLMHLRRQGIIHVRGCWALDTILNRD